MTSELKLELEHAGVEARLVDLFARNMEPTEGKSGAELEALIGIGQNTVLSFKFRNWIVNWREIALGAGSVLVGMISIYPQTPKARRFYAHWKVSRC